MKPALTVAMACYDDFHGVFFTVQALRMYQDMKDCEIIVLDNNPESPEGHETKGFINNVQNAEIPIHYIAYTENQGTTQTRQRLFDHAQGDSVLVMDCHVLLKPGAIGRLKEFYRTAGPEMEKNLFTGPLLMDGLGYQMTHFECEWRAEMWGIWAVSWRSPEGVLMVSKEINQELHMRPLNHPEMQWMRSGIRWQGHEAELKSKGFKLAGWEDDEHPFEIPAQGLGLFSSKKEHWLGFNPDFRQFGGEECYIHEKYRQAGRKAMCLPFLKWNHRFGRPGGPKYPLTREGKIRNYILGFQELGMDIAPIKEHFCGPIGVPGEVFDYIAKDAKNFDPTNNPFISKRPNTRPDNVQAVSKSNMGMDLPVLAEDLHSMAMEIGGIPRDLDKHAHRLMELASECKHVTEFSERRESTMFLAAGLARKKQCAKQCTKETCDKSCQVELVSFQKEQDSLLSLIKAAIPTTPGRQVTYTNKNWQGDRVPAIGPTDMLFLDTSNSEVLANQLNDYAGSVGKYIVMHDTMVHANKDNRGEEGLVPAIKRFLHNNPEWFVYRHTDDQYGLTVLAKDPALRPSERVAPWSLMREDGTPCGVGSEIKAFLAKIGIHSTDNCPCNALARKYNFEGPDWCEANIEEILDKLKEQAVSRSMGHLFIRPAVKLMVKRAIRKTRKAIESGECF